MSNLYSNVCFCRMPGELADIDAETLDRVSKKIAQAMEEVSDEEISYQELVCALVAIELSIATGIRMQSSEKQTFEFMEQIRQGVVHAVLVGLKDAENVSRTTH